jgi:RimJ/RimL family protein N-acetyltransferase
MDLSVRELGAEEIGIRVRYFHEASDEHLALMGADRARFPTPEEWIATYVDDMARPTEERQLCTLGWVLDGDVVGFASLDRITYGDEGRFHLHILQPERRQRGLGVPFVRLSATRFVEMFALRRVVSEPNAFNTAPNRTLQRAGWRYDRTYVTTPGPINVEQPVTRWVLDATDLVP